MVEKTGICRELFAQEFIKRFFNKKIPRSCLRQVSNSWARHGSYIRGQLRNECARQEKSLLFDLLKAFPYIGYLSPKNPIFPYAFAAYQTIYYTYNERFVLLLDMTNTIQFLHNYVAMKTQPESDYNSLSLSISLCLQIYLFIHYKYTSISFTPPLYLSKR